MALIKEYFNDQFNITIADCYWKIEIDNGLTGGKEKLRVRMNCFKDREIANTNQNKFKDFDFQFVPDLESVDNFLTQAYAYAKTLPEFTEAVDV